MPVKQRSPKGLKRVKCSCCRGVRLHELATRKDEAGKFIRVWICSACFSTSPAGGYCCWDCGYDRFMVGKNGTSKHSRPGSLVRMKICCRCWSEFDEVAKIERRHATTPQTTADRPPQAVPRIALPRTWEEALAQLSEKAFRSVRRCGIWERWVSRAADRLNRRAARGAAPSNQGCEVALPP